MSPYAQLESTSSHAKTLAVTEARQYRDRGLVHISDACFKVFLYMEQLRVDLMNASSLQKQAKSHFQYVGRDERKRGTKDTGWHVFR